MKRHGKNESGDSTTRVPGALARLVFVLALFLFSARAEATGTEFQMIRGAEFSEEVAPYVVDEDLRDLSTPPPWKPGDPIKEVPRRRTAAHTPATPPEARLDPLLEIQEYAGPTTVSRAFSTMMVNMDGMGFSGVNPPDTVGDVGRDYYIQSTNGSSGTYYTIYDKSDGDVAAGPLMMSDLGGSSGAGDPIVLYDSLAQRWLISEFASMGNKLIVYISQTSDPISGGWYVYEFTTPNFPDYPKYAVWPDAYYVTSNESSPTAYALPREEMLAGEPASFQRFTAAPLSGFGFNVITPCDLDGGAAPPTDAPNYMMRHRDDEAHGGSDPSQDYLEIFEFNVDWDDPGSSTFSGPVSIPVADFDSNLNGLIAFEAIAQPGSSVLLDPLREPVMHRLVYRNFGSHETLVGCFATDVDGTDHAGVRWFELRKSGGGAWALHQEGTFSPDGHSRWMASIAMDGSGNIALGYNVSSSSVYPGLRYVGRLASDPSGAMLQGEYTIVNGSAANASNRYGDYSAMSIDPVNDCTFWFTGQYNASGSWSTRIASFEFESCGCASSPGPSNVHASANGANRIDISWSGVVGATSYNVYRSDGSCSSPSFTLLQQGVVGLSYSDTTVSGGAEYAYAVTGFNASEGCESDKSDCAGDTATGQCTLAPTFGGVASASSAGEETCAIQLTWSAGEANCGGSLVYNLYRSTSAGFTPGPANLLEDCFTGTSYKDLSSLSGGAPYFYAVRAEDGQGIGQGSCSGGPEDANTVRIEAAATGPETARFEDDMESGTGQWTTAAGPADGGGTESWTMVDSDSHSLQHAWFCSDEGVLKDQVVETAEAVNLPADALSAHLSFWHRVDTEHTYDGGVLEYSMDDGASWFDILDGDGADVPADSGRFIANGYNSVISTLYSSPIAGRKAWSGASSSFEEVVVDVSDFLGRSPRFRWRMACDELIAQNGWWVDDVTVAHFPDCASCEVGALSIVGARGLSFHGPKGGPFQPSGGSYAITNTGSCPISWTASKTKSWLTLTPSDGGVLPAFGSVALGLELNSAATGLDTGQYTDVITFSNIANGRGNTTGSVKLGVYTVHYVDPDATGNCGGRSPCHHSIQSAIDAAGDMAMLKLMRGEFRESIVTNGNVVYLDGGWNTDFSARSASTPTILSGPWEPTVEIDRNITARNLVVK